MSRCHRVLWALAAVLALAGLSLHVARAASLSGTVTLTPGDQPSSGVWVSAIRLGDYLKYTTDDDAVRARGTARVAVTDAQGSFSFRDLAPGEYEVWVRADSLPPSLAPLSKPVRTVLVSAKDAASVDLSVTRLCVIEGLARRQNAGPLTSVRVQAFHHGDTKPFAETWTGAHGEFRIGGLERNVPVDLVASTSEGQYSRVTKTPLKAGAQPAEIVLPSWSSATKRHVEVTVILPTSSDRHYELDWISKPEEAPTGYRTTVSLDRDGHGELDSPTGIFLARVRESGGGSASERTWTAERFYKVDASGSGAVLVRIDLSPEQQPAPSSEQSSDSTTEHSPTPHPAP
jgi:hypothetical protein